LKLFNNPLHAPLKHLYFAFTHIRVWKN